MRTYQPNTLSAQTIIGDKVVNPQGEHLGEIKELMLDLNSGRINYAVLSFGGFLGMGDKLFALPWDTLQVDPENKQFILNVDKELLKNAPGFDKDNWPGSADTSFITGVYRHYGVQPYWETTEHGAY